MSQLFWELLLLTPLDRFQWEGDLKLLVLLLHHLPAVLLLVQLADSHQLADSPLPEAIFNLQAESQLLTQPLQPFPEALMSKTLKPYLSMLPEAILLTGLLKSLNQQLPPLPAEWQFFQPADSCLLQDLLLPEAIFKPRAESLQLIVRLLHSPADSQLALLAVSHQLQVSLLLEAISSPLANSPLPQQQLLQYQDHWILLELEDYKPHAFTIAELL